MLMCTPSGYTSTGGPRLEFELKKLPSESDDNEVPSLVSGQRDKRVSCI